MPKKKEEDAGPKPITIHTCALTLPQAQKLRGLLTERGWKFDARPYTLYFAQRDKLTVAVYEKGPKCVVQGRGTQEFVQFTLEPEVLGEARLGYEELHNPEMFEPHFGVDESGKGDFFGPLVIAGAYTDAETTRALMEAGIMDSKRITSDARIRELAKAIRGTDGIAFSSITLVPEKYNALYKKFGNLNRMLGWGHAKVIEHLVEQRPDCPRALSDKFASPALITRQLTGAAREIQLDARTKAESDTAVAAASILARERFINWLRDTGREMEVELPRGASEAVKNAGRDLVARYGPEVLTRVAKVHFKTAHDVAPAHYKYVEKPPFVRRRTSEKNAGPKNEGLSS
jgi:ribonuclease HIII